MLGTNIQSAHAPLMSAVTKITTYKGESDYIIPPSERKNDDNKKGRTYDDDMNMAQDYLETKLSTQQNQC